MAISTADLSLMPGIEPLRRMLLSVSMVEAILGSGLGYRADYQFDAHWREGEQLCRWDNQQGDNFFAVFNADGVWFKGFTHEAGISPFRFEPPVLWPGMFRGMPAVFKKYLLEPDFECDEATTFCIWRRTKDKTWRRGRFDLPPQTANSHPLFRDEDLSATILDRLGWSPEQWHAHEEEDYERDLDREIIVRIFNHEPLKKEWIGKLDARASVSFCRDEAAKIGYPMMLDLW